MSGLTATPVPVRPGADVRHARTGGPARVVGPCRHAGTGQEGVCVEGPLPGQYTYYTLEAFSRLFGPPEGVRQTRPGAVPEKVADQTSGGGGILMRGRVILSLCDYTGNWPRPYAEAGYDVRTVDVLSGTDVRLMPRPHAPVHGILAAPPCTVFAASGNRWPRTPEEIAAALAVVDACLRLVAVCRPVWWCLENPRGKLARYLGPPAMRFDPCDFGLLASEPGSDAYTKHTCLWGHFVPPVPLLSGRETAVPPDLGSKMHRLPGVRPQDSPALAARKRLARSATPSGFARAFFLANP